MKPRTAGQRLSAVAAVAMFLGLVMIPFAANSHSGGTDENGCHAGSQPYHCHGGGGGGGGGGNDDDGGSSGSGSSSNTGPTAAERAAAEAAAAERAALSEARSELLQATSKETAEEREVAELERQHAAAREEVSRLRQPRETLAEKVARYQELADNRRDDRIAKNEAAAARLAAIADDNRDARRAYHDEVVVGVFAAALFAGFLLLALVKSLAALIVPWRWAWVLGGFLSSMLFFNFGLSVHSLVFGGVLAGIGGLLLSVVLMLSGIWWLRFAVPTPATLVLLGVAAILVAVSVLGFVAQPPPVPQQPSSSDVAKAEEAESDPNAENLPEANQAEAAANKLEPELNELDTKLAEAENEEKEFAKLLATAKSELAAARQERIEAESSLESLQ